MDLLGSTHPSLAGWFNTLNTPKHPRRRCVLTDDVRTSLNFVCPLGSYFGPSKRTTRTTFWFCVVHFEIFLFLPPRKLFWTLEANHSNHLLVLSDGTASYGWAKYDYFLILLAILGLQFCGASCFSKPPHLSD